MPLLVGGKACEVIHCLWPQVLPTGVDDGGCHLVQQLFAGADAVGYVELFPTLLNSELWVRVHRIQKVVKGAVGKVCFESGD